LGLSAPQQASISRASQRVGIVDNDNVVATPRLYVRDAIVDEQDGLARVSVVLGGPNGQASNSTVSVNYATSDGSAGGSDYGALSGTLSFAPGQTVKTLLVPITDDGSPGPAERFSRALSTPSAASLADGTGAVTIGDTDRAAT